MAAQGDDRLETALARFAREGEEFRRFSYTFKDDKQSYHTAYYYPRKEGPTKVTGFVVIDQDGHVLPRQEAVPINQAFNRYNLLFKRFQHEWGDVVEQDLRKHQGVLPHFETLRELIPHDHPLLPLLKKGEETVRQVLADQEQFLSLDLAAIDVGRRKRENESIDRSIDEEVERIITRFERTLFNQYHIQYQLLPTIKEYEQYLKDHSLPKAWKKPLKKVKRIFKRMAKHVLKSEGRLKERMEDPENTQYYVALYARWEELVRN